MQGAKNAGSLPEFSIGTDRPETIMRPRTPVRLKKSVGFEAFLIGPFPTMSKFSIRRSRIDRIVGTNIVTPEKPCFSVLSSRIRHQPHPEEAWPLHVCKGQ